MNGYRFFQIRMNKKFNLFTFFLSGFALHVLMESRILLSLCLISFCFFSHNSASADLKKVVILQTSDIHCHLGIGKESNNEFAIDSSGCGWLKIASLIRSEIQKAGGRDKILLIDCGDTFQGTLSGALSKGQAGAEMLNLVGYDAWIPGNHDFDFGLERLLELLPKIESEKLASNLDWSQAGGLIKPWKLYSKNGAKIAVIGATFPRIDGEDFIGNEKLEDFKVESIQQGIDSVMPEVMESRPDMIILAVHLGLNQDKNGKRWAISEIAQRYPQIDLILGAHSHVTNSGERVGLSSWFVQPGKNAETLSKIEALIDTDKKCVKSLNSYLIFSDKNIEDDAVCGNGIRKWIEKSSNFSAKRIGETLAPLSPPDDPLSGSPLTELFCGAISESSGCKVVFCGTAVSGAALNGPITEEDLFNIIPYENTICVLNLSGADVRTILKEQFRQKDKKPFQYLWGIHAKTDREGNIIGKMEFGNGGFWENEDNKIRIAFNSYAVSGAGGCFKDLKLIALKQETMTSRTGIKVRDSLREYIRKHSPLKIISENEVKTPRLKEVKQ